MAPMERIVDKAIVLVCCLACFAVMPWEVVLLLALLAAVAASALGEALPERFAFLPALVYALAAFAWPSFAAFLALAVYDLARDDHLAIRWCWLLPTLSAFVRLEAALALLMALACAMALLLSYRTRRFQTELAAYRRLRDDVQETSLALEEKNRGLRDRQDLEVRLATLAERGRIAREIHDNVGHLLTRSIMQVEALQVVHADDEQVRDELEAVGETLHEAMGTVRASVHDLHDDAFDLRAQLQRAIAACGLPDVRLTFDARDVPLPVAYGLLSVVREALSNVAKHSDATRVDVSVIEYPALYQLVVQDNGTTAAGSGDASASSRGIGLHTMEERIGALGGRLRAEHRKGFRVFASIPKKQQGEDGK